MNVESPVRLGGVKRSHFLSPEKQPESVGKSATRSIPEVEQSKTAVLNTLPSQHLSPERQIRHRKVYRQVLFLTERNG